MRNLNGILKSEGHNFLFHSDSLWLRRSPLYTPFGDNPSSLLVLFDGWHAVVGATGTGRQFLGLASLVLTSVALEIYPKHEKDATIYSFYNYTIVLSISHSIKVPLTFRTRRVLSSRLSSKWNYWGGPRDETAETEISIYMCGTIKIPSFIKAVGFEHRTKFCDPSPTIVTIHVLYKRAAGRK